jgi:hypothetical protein
MKFDKNKNDYVHGKLFAVQEFSTTALQTWKAGPDTSARCSFEGPPILFLVKL